jgi:membrane protease YdiL (CAAX protease family)
MTKPTVFQRILSHIESPTPAYSGYGETALAVSVLPLTFIYKLLDCLYGKQPIPGQPWLYIILLSAFTSVAFSSVFFLATPCGARRIQRMLLENRLTRLALLPILYVGLFLLTLWLLGLPQLYTHALAMITEPWSQLPLPFFLLLTALLLFSGLRGGLSLALRLSTANSASGFGLRQLGCVLLATLPFLLLQEQLPLLWCFTTPIALLVMIYGTGLGRAYFNYSFVPTSTKGALSTLALLLGGLSIFLIANFISGAASYTGNLWHTSWVTLYDSIFVYLLIVGVSEEIIFRCGLLTLVTAQFAKKKTPSWYAQKPRLSAVILISILFGLVHFPRGISFAFFALLASLLYGLAFVTSKSLFGPVLLHGLLNVMVLMNFHLADF